ncbi:ABC transporter substrate-binding protein [Dactylosporangium sp. NPDC051485]|uniref:ABC transporter substrate-binding protein n=1 Tax=Dactylosporangium sp. NPDC051485 TaxID=3154846 RepID=UPI00341B088E
MKRPTRPSVQRLVAVSAATGLLAIAGCGNSSMDTDTADSSSGGEVKIGLIVPKTGDYKTVGDDLHDGWQLYLDQHGGKLGGRKVTVVEADEGDGGETARTAAKKMLEQDRVVAIVGGATAPTTATLQPLVTAAGVPFIGTGGRPSTVSDVTHVWHTSWLSQETGAAAADYVRTTVNGPVFAIGPDYIGGRDNINGFVKPFTAGGGKLANADGEPEWTPWTPPTTNFAPYLTKIKKSDAKAVYAFYGGKSAAEFVKQYKQFGISIPLYGPGFLTEGLLPLLGDAGVGVWTCLNYASTLDTTANRQFVAAYQTAHQGKTPNLYNVTAWDAALILDRAITAVTQPAATPATSSTSGTSSASAPAPTLPAVSPPSASAVVAASSVASIGPLPAGTTASGTSSVSGSPRAGGRTVAGVDPAALNAAIGALGQIDSPRGPWQFGSLNHTPVQKWYLRRVQADGTTFSNVVVQELATLGA